jgi:hypothetical protein
MNLGHFVHEKAFCVGQNHIFQLKLQSPGPSITRNTVAGVCMYVCMYVWNSICFGIFPSSIHMFPKSTLPHPKTIMIQGPHYQIANSTLKFCQIAESTSSYGVPGRVSSCLQISNFLGCSRLKCVIWCAQNFQTAPLPLPPPFLFFFPPQNSTIQKLTSIGPCPKCSSCWEEIPF